MKSHFRTDVVCSKTLIFQSRGSGNFVQSTWNVPSSKSLAIDARFLEIRISPGHVRSICLFRSVCVCSEACVPRETSSGNLRNVQANIIIDLVAEAVDSPRGRGLSSLRRNVSLIRTREQVHEDTFRFSLSLSLLEKLLPEELNFIFTLIMNDNRQKMKKKGGSLIMAAFEFYSQRLRLKCLWNFSTLFKSEIERVELPNETWNCCKRINFFLP